MTLAYLCKPTIAIIEIGGAYGMSWLVSDGAFVGIPDPGFFAYPARAFVGSFCEGKSVDRYLPPPAV